MAVWLVRAGRHGEHESLALEQNMAVIGWTPIPDLWPVQTRGELEELCQRSYPDKEPKTITNWVSQLWAFRQRMEKDDLVVLPLKSRSVIAIGRVDGDYKYRPDHPDGAHHTRPVKWLRSDIPRSAFEQDILYSFGAFMTVCQIKRNNAEERIRAILEGIAPPVKPGTPIDKEPDGGEPEPPPNPEEYARDQIISHIGQKFMGHDFARLVTELLKVQGYKVQMSPPGPDGGVDIIAGRGPMGFEPPRLCVQVKSGNQPVDVKILHELQGVMKNFGANQSLLVSWGGFKQSVYKEARRLFFEVRLWDAGDLVDVLLENYDRLPEEIQAELPLKRIWALVPKEQE